MAIGILKSLVGPVTGLGSEFIEDNDKANQLAHDIATLAEKQHHEQGGLPFLPNHLPNQVEIVR